jgi:two-component system sensor histidine kinase/response regulator
MNSLRILVAEDSRTQAESLRYILEKDGHRVTLAANGRLALESIATDRPDMVLSDIMMPDIDGYELSRRIKQDPETRSIPVILVTQLFDPVDVVRGLESGADNFIIKPYEPSEIGSRIDQTFQASQPVTGELPGGIRIHLTDGAHTINTGRAQILNILLSTYEVAVRKNYELQDAHERLNLVNDRLQQAVVELKASNADLFKENIERMRIEKALAGANKKLQLMASITRHDLVNRLCALQEYIELSLAYREKDPVRAWDNISSASAIVHQTINTVEFTGNYQKIGMISPMWVELRSLVDDTQKYISLGTVRLENAIPERTEIYADPLIEKVFLNLVDNALKYGGKITTIRFCFDEDGSPRIICEDDGIGIGLEEKENIFTYEYGMNTGLGLFLAREILAITGITIRETGIPGEGARFELQCPPDKIRGFNSPADPDSGPH